MPGGASKEERLLAVADCIVQIMVSRRSDSLAIGALARKAGVSRAWLYKYVGRNKKELVENALSYLERDFTGRFDRQPVRDLESLKAALLEGNLKLIASTRRNPAIIQLYFGSLLFTAPWATRVRQAENSYIREVLGPEIERCLGVSRNRAIFMAESISSLRMTVMQRWVLQREPARMSEKQVKGLLDRVVEFLLQELRPEPKAQKASPALKSKITSPGAA
ncbi:MAG: TetR/AcrR family transcriptional regulator [Oligoflexia bacterium]|nr:TetR/AcrR family transcriptional regulator [Oligoflexia bacterium]